MSHANARLTPHGRLLLVRRVLAGRPPAHVAKELGVSRQCVYTWLARYRDEGEAGLQDRSTARTPARTARPVTNSAPQLVLVPLGNRPSAAKTIASSLYAPAHYGVDGSSLAYATAPEDPDKITPATPIVIHVATVTIN